MFILCSRPNISKHLEKLKHIENAIILPYQFLLLLEPRYSANPYAYSYEKVIKQIEDIIDNFKNYYNIYMTLEDEKSKEIFIKMLIYRLTYDYKMNEGIATKYAHYFDADIIKLTQEEIFVDCGGYIGDTLDEFKKQTMNCFKKYYLFEPDRKLIDIAKEKGDERVEYINKGVWNEETKLYFKEQTANGNGTIVKENSEDIIEVPVTNLDANIKKATFIKMDIEGSELMGLQGAYNLITEHYPKLAICVYHKYEDFRELFDFINQFGIYKIYLRAEMNNIDTELYYLCIPQIK